MESCWDQNPSQRPNFNHIVHVLTIFAKDTTNIEELKSAPEVMNLIDTQRSPEIDKKLRSNTLYKQVNCLSVMFTHGFIKRGIKLFVELVWPFVQMKAKGAIVLSNRSHEKLMVLFIYNSPAQSEMADIYAKENKEHVKEYIQYFCTPIVREKFDLIENTKLRTNESFLLKDFVPKDNVQNHVLVSVAIIKHSEYSAARELYKDMAAKLKELGVTLSLAMMQFSNGKLILINSFKDAKSMKFFEKGGALQTFVLKFKEKLTSMPVFEHYFLEMTLGEI